MSLYARQLKNNSLNFHPTQMRIRRYVTGIYKIFKHQHNKYVKIAEQF